jgi:adenylate kinase
MNAKVNSQQVDKIKDWLGAGSINIFGLPYSGKDTQGRILSKLLNAPLVGSGDILRKSERVSQSTREIIDQGFLAPTQEFLAIVSPYLSSPEFSGKPLILSSIGRWHGEESSIVKSADRAGHPIKAVLFLKLEEDQIQKRWQVAQDTQERGQRADDEAAKIAKRIDEFQTKTMPVIDYYRDQGILIELDGNQEPDTVSQQIVNKLSAFSAHN